MSATSPASLAGLRRSVDDPDAGGREGHARRDRRRRRPPRPWPGRLVRRVVVTALAAEQAERHRRRHGPGRRDQCRCEPERGERRAVETGHRHDGGDGTPGGRLAAVAGRARAGRAIRAAGGPAAWIGAGDDGYLWRIARLLGWGGARDDRCRGRVAGDRPHGRHTGEGVGGRRSVRPSGPPSRSAGARAGWPSAGESGGAWAAASGWARFAVRWSARAWAVGSAWAWAPAWASASPSASGSVWRLVRS